MTNRIEILDALPGCGKTHSIFDWIAKNQHLNIIYMTPSLLELDERVQKECADRDITLDSPVADSRYTKSEKALIALNLTRSLCITHELFYNFNEHHIEAIRKGKYVIISDEELGFLDPYQLRKEDYDFLQANNLTVMDDKTGQITFTGTHADEGSKYWDVRCRANTGSLFGAVNSPKFMVTVISPKLVHAAERFIVLTYGYTGCLMESFLGIHNIQTVEFTEAKLKKSTVEAVANLQQRIKFVSDDIAEEIGSQCSLSSTWWKSTTVSKAKRLTQRAKVSNAIRKVLDRSGLNKADLMYTIPVSSCERSLGFETSKIGKDPVVGEEHTRSFLPFNTRSTNIYANKKLAVHAYDLHPHAAVKAYLQSQGRIVDIDTYARNHMVQWFFRSCIRKDTDDVLQVCILSSRMRSIFKQWLILT